MRIAFGAAIAILPTLAIVAACGTTPSAATDEPIELPDRAAPPDTGKEAAATDSSAPPNDAAADSDGALAQKLCAEPDLLLCFSFEGEVKEGSLNPFVPIDTQGVTFAPGKVGQAAVLTDTSYMRYAALPLLTVPISTVEAWVKPTQLLAESVIFDADERYAMAALPDGSLKCNSTVVVSGGQLPIGAWTHVACVYDGAKVLLYVGGVLVTMADGTNGLAPVSTASAIAGNAPSGQPFVGAIDSFRVFKSARTAAQIAAAAQ